MFFTSSFQSEGGSTVDQSEAAKFNTVEWNWWHANGLAKALHTMNALRVPLIRNTLLGHPPDDITSTDHTPYPLRGCTVLEIGSGAGILCEVSVILCSPSHSHMHTYITLKSHLTCLHPPTHTCLHLHNTHTHRSHWQD